MPNRDSQRQNLRESFSDFVPTKTLFHIENEKVLAELDEFRSEFEKLHGPTDFVQRYTSQLQTDEQERLFQEEPLKYFDGLPAFVQAFYKEQWAMDASNGKLDNLPSDMLRLYVALRKRSKSS